MSKTALQTAIHTFEYHQPSDGQIDRISAVRKSCIKTVRVLFKNCPESADRSAAVRLLHEAMMTANKSIVCDEPEPEAAEE